MTAVRFCTEPTEGHAHVAGYRFCHLCGIHAPLDCPTCAKVHVRLHHNGRRLRRAEKMMKGGKR